MSSPIQEAEVKRADELKKSLLDASRRYFLAKKELALLIDQMQQRYVPLIENIDKEFPREFKINQEVI
jgi:hypothetical protein